MKIKKNKLIFIILIYILYINLLPGYYTLLPTLPVYPNNYEDLKIMKQEISQQTQSDIKFFFLTNKTVVNAFMPYVSESRNKLLNISTSHNNMILMIKYLINRRRPYQIDKNIQPLNISTAETPSYPAGHAYQALLVSSYLSKKYPEKKKLFDKIAIQCDNCRVKAGLHYKSDGEFSRKLFYLLNPNE